MLSIGGRATLLKSVLGSLGIYYMSIFRMPVIVNKYLESLRAKFFWGCEPNERKIHWIQWKMILANKENGGLDIESLEAFNQALILKWKWRFYNDNQALWVNVIKSIYGEEGGLGWTTGFRSRNKGIWKNILGTINSLHDKNIISLNSFSKRVGNGMHTKFWKEIWIGETPLMLRYPRLFSLELNKDCTVANRWSDNSGSWNWRHNNFRGISSSQLVDLELLLHGFQLSPSTPDRWIWSEAPDLTFSVKQARCTIDHHILPIGSTSTLWNRFVPRKVNIFFWRCRLNRLPTRVNLDHKGLDVPSILCSICASQLEDSDHIFFLCPTSHLIWKSIGKWCDLDFPSFSNVADMIAWVDNAPISRTKTLLLQAIVTTTCRVI